MSETQAFHDRIAECLGGQPSPELIAAVAQRLEQDNLAAPSWFEIVPVDMLRPQVVERARAVAAQAAHAKAEQPLTQDQQVTAWCERHNIDLSKYLAADKLRIYGHALAEIAKESRSSDVEKFVTEISLRGADRPMTAADRLRAANLGIGANQAKAPPIALPAPPAGASPEAKLAYANRLNGPLNGLWKEYSTLAGNIKKMPPGLERFKSEEYLGHLRRRLEFSGVAVPKP